MKGTVNTLFLDLYKKAEISSLTIDEMDFLDAFAQNKIDYLIIQDITTFSEQYLYFRKNMSWVDFRANYNQKYNPDIELYINSNNQITIKYNDEMCILYADADLQTPIDMSSTMDLYKNVYFCSSAEVISELEE